MLLSGSLWSLIWQFVVGRVLDMFDHFEYDVYVSKRTSLFMNKQRACLQCFIRQWSLISIVRGWLCFILYIFYVRMMYVHGPAAYPHAILQFYFVSVMQRGHAIPLFIKVVSLLVKFHIIFSSQHFIMLMTVFLQGVSIRCCQFSVLSAVMPRNLAEFIGLSSIFGGMDYSFKFTLLVLNLTWSVLETLRQSFRLLQILVAKIILDRSFLWLDNLFFGLINSLNIFI